MITRLILHVFCIGNDSSAGETVSFNAAVISDDNAVEGGANNVAAERTALHIQDNKSESLRMFQSGCSSVDVFVQEMMNASNWNDVRGRTTKLLESLEKSILAHSTTTKTEEIAASLKEQLHSMLKDNNILKKGIQIQHEHNLEQEEKLKEAPRLKHFVGQCQEQIRKLEMSNYTLRLHLQRAQESETVPGCFH